MSITFISETNQFWLDTKNTRYAFAITHGKFPVHLHYGKKEEVAINKQIISFAPFYKEIGLDYLPDYCMGEYNGYDSGDFRGYSLRIRGEKGDSVTMLRYQGHRILEGRPALPNLPFAAADEHTQTLELTLVDDVTKVQVSLYYTVFEQLDVISRYVQIQNQGQATLSVEKCMSLLLDLPHHDFDMITLHGGYANECNMQRVPLHYGLQGGYSRRGGSGHQMNPFMALCKHDATYHQGEVYGFNFVYSGSFANEVEVDQTGKTRVQIGLGSDTFRWQLKAGESFVSPEAVMTFSGEGIGGMSRNFHRFVRNCILPPEPFENRPVVLNTWEACFFDIDQNTLFDFARAAADANIDMVVMDDGWFGERNHDRAGLGDWVENKAKFPNGLHSFVEQMKGYGVKFGIWIEPEMVNPDSELYRNHPDWCLGCKGRAFMESRNQLVLDLGNPQVLSYLKETFSKTFDGVAIDYFKWDCNRNLSQVGSLHLPPEQQEEAAHRYMLGVYNLLEWFRTHFPKAMIETCSGGGGRYDLGMMKYSNMIWTSDQTDPHARIPIQHGALLGYPACVMSCHVSNHKACEDPQELQYRFHVALGGPLGYELHLPNASSTVRNTIKEQVALYRTLEDFILRGNYYPLLSPYETNYSAYYYADDEGKGIFLSFVQQQAEQETTLHLPIEIADPKGVYVDEINGGEYTGEQLLKGVEIFTRSIPNHSKIWCFKRIR